MLGFVAVAAVFLFVWGLMDLVRAGGHLLCALGSLLVCLYHLARR